MKKHRALEKNAAPVFTGQMTSTASFSQNPPNKPESDQVRIWSDHLKIIHVPVERSPTPSGIFLATIAAHI
jgi:hypothetical protein